MSESLSQVVETYKALTKGKYVVKDAKTPCIDENLLPDPQLEANAISESLGNTSGNNGISKNSSGAAWAAWVWLQTDRLQLISLETGGITAIAIISVFIMISMGFIMVIMAGTIRKLFSFWRSRQQVPQC